MKIIHKQPNSKGFCPDKAPDTLPIGATSFSINLKNTSAGWEKSDGFNLSAVSPSEDGTYLAYYSPSKADDRWLVAGATKIEMLYAATVEDVSRVGGYTETGKDLWTHVNFNGVIIFNNEADVPQYFTGEGFLNLENFPGAYRARTVRQYGSYLLCLGINIGDGFRDSDVLWSHPADPGTIPISWDYTSTSMDAGLTTLPSEGYLVDSLELGSFNVIYKSDSTWVQRLIGGQYIFSFDKLFAGQGILATDCVVAYEEYHFVVTQNDIVIHNGSTMESVAEGSVKNFFFDDMSKTFFWKTFVTKNPVNNEIMIVYPNIDSEGACNRMLVWNWRTKIWEYRSAPNVLSANLGYEIKDTSETWANTIEPWQSGGAWTNQKDLSQYSPVVHFISEDYTALISASQSKNWVGIPVESVWESDTCVIGKLDRYGTPVQNYEVLKTLVMLMFDVIGNDDYEISIRVKDRLGFSGDWVSYGTLNSNTDKRLHVLETADYFGIRVVSSSPDFVLRGVQIEWEESGEMW